MTRADYLAKAFDTSKHPRSHTGEFAAAAGVVAATGALIAAAPAIDRAAQVRGRKQYRRQVTALKAAGGQVMYRGAPNADPNPVPRKFGSVYMTPDKDVARFFGKTINRHALVPGAKLLDMHHPDTRMLLEPRLHARLPKDGTQSGFNESRLSRLSPSQHTIIRGMGYDGVEVPQFERHDGYAISNMKATRYLGSGVRGGPLKILGRFARLTKVDVDDMAKRAPEIAQSIISKTKTGETA